MSYLGHSLGESYPSAEFQSVYSTALADWAEEEPVEMVSMHDTTISQDILRKSCWFSVSRVLIWVNFHAYLLTEANMLGRRNGVDVKLRTRIKKKLASRFICAFLLNYSWAKFVSNHFKVGSCTLLGHKNSELHIRYRALHYHLFS